MKMKKLTYILFAGFALTFCAQGLNATPKAPRKVAVQTYTFNKNTLEETLKVISPIGIDAVELWTGQRIGGAYPDVKANQSMTPEQRAYVKKLLNEYGVKIISMGVAGANDEAGITALCEFAKDMDIPLIVTEAPEELFPLWQKHCEKYGLKMCIHNHEKGSKNGYYDYNLVAKIIKPYTLIGACADNGGWSRSGLDCVTGIKALGGKIFEIHFKDQKTFNDPKSDAVIYGQGVVDLKGMLAELDKQGFDGYFVIEHGNAGDKAEIVRKDLEFLKNN